VPSVIALALLALGAAGWWWYRGRDEARQVVYAVPPGTVARLAAGEELAVLPDQINLTLGARDILVIRNDDTQPVQVGPFKVEPGQRFTQRYYNRGTYDLICSIHRSERLRIVVE
jgi:hypothetical protein